MPKLSSSLQNLVEPIIKSLGYEFWGGSYGGQGSRALLRIYIEKEGGITVEDCQKVSRQLSAVLDVENVIAHQYVLEVSSPGIERPLFTLAQFEKFIGKTIRFKVHAPIDGQTNFVGEIVRVTNDKLIVKVNTNELELPFSEIEKANLKM